MKNLFFLALCAALLSMAAAAADDAPDCSKCKAFPASCRVIDACVKECKTPAREAKKCYQAAKITKAHCDKLYDKCVDPCDSCDAFPLSCGIAAKCVSECGRPPALAENCFRAGKISEADCKAIDPACKAADPKCAVCNSFPGFCGTLASCVKSCGLERRKAHDCKNIGMITLDACKKVYPACQ